MYAVRNLRLCTKDCLCLYVCPTGATDTENGQVDAKKCIGCGLCVKACPSHALFTRLFGIQWAGANVLSWVLSVLFAYVTNRTWVFEHRAHGTGPILREMGLFFGCRLLSFFCDMAIMFLCVDVLHINDLIAKVFTQVVVIVLNYVFSKWIIFRGPKK